MPFSVADELAHMDDEYTWVTLCTTTSTSLGPGLRDLEHELRCGICHEFYRVPVSVQPCQHTFCSTCIHSRLTAGLRSTQSKAKCPTCRTVLNHAGRAFEKCLAPNHTVAAIVKTFRAVREELKTAVSTAATTTTSLQPAVASEGTEATSTGENNTDDSPAAALACSLRRSLRSPSLIEKTATAPAVKPPNPVAPLKPKPKPAYNSLKKKQLHTLLQKQGLPTTGSEQDCINRHRKWIVFYNSQCYYMNTAAQQQPDTEAQLLQEFLQQERRQTQQALQDAADPTTRQFHQVATMAGKPVAPALQQQLNRNFAAMIRKHQAKKKKAKGKQSDHENEKNFDHDLEDRDGKKRLESSTKPNAESSRNTEDGRAHPSAREKDHATGSNVAVRRSNTSDETQDSSDSVSPSDPSVRHTGYRSGGSLVRPVAVTQQSRSGNKRCLAPALQPSLASATPPPPSASQGRWESPSTTTTTTSSSNKKRRLSTTSIVGKWQCPRCTFFNEIHIGSRAHCEACRTPRTMAAVSFVQQQQQQQQDVVTID